ncbi:AAA family ATPase [Micrococcus luteus]|uniref:AAA family ATPase n=1 Tax=Micrococcus luteus TaxID=1270 RepID=UPI0036B1E162
MLAATPAGTNDPDRPLIGREALLAQLLQIADHVAEGHVRAVVLSGPAGSGKTALLEAFLRRSARRRPETGFFSAVGDPWERQLPLAGYSQLMQTAPVRSQKAYDPAREPAAVPGETLTPTQAAHHAATFMVHLEAHQAQGSVIVAVDDVHAMDEASLRILVFAMRRLRDRRVMFVLTLDPAREHGLPTGLLAGYQVLRLTLDPLDGDQVQELARQRRHLEITPQAAQRVVEHTRGLPLPIVELLDELPEQTWEDWFPSLPATARMRAQVEEQLRSGSARLADVAYAVAVLGPGAGLDTIRRVLDDPGDDPMSDREVLQALDEGHRVRLLRLSAADAPVTVGFVDPGASSAVYDLIPPSTRQALHRRAAAAVGEESGRLAHRAAATIGVDEELALELESFASRQASVGAWNEVATALFAASRLSEDGAARADRLLRAVDALVGAGSVAHAKSWRSAVDAMAPSPLRSSVLGYLSTVSGAEQSAGALLHGAWEAAGPDTDPAVPATVAQRLVLHSLAHWDGPGITRWAETAQDLAGRDTPAHFEAQAIHGLGLYAQGRWDEAEESYRRAFAAAEEGPQKQRVLMGAGWLALRLDDVDQALMNFEAAAPVGARGWSLRIALWAEAWLARTQLVLGEWDAAAATVIRAESRLQAAGMPLIGPLLHWTGAELWALRGDHERARHHLARATAHRGSYRVMLVPTCLARARLHESRGDYPAALEALEPLTEIDPWTPGRVSFWPWQDTYVNALVMTNRLSRAEEFLTDLAAVPRARIVATDEARLDWAWGRLLAAQGDPDAARARFEDALGRLEGLHRPYLRARINFAFGQSMRRAGKRRLAHSVLQTARELYAGFGALTYVERCDRELNATGMLPVGDTGPEAAAPVLGLAGVPEDDLTAQEKAVAALVASGATNKEVARSLFLAEKTVQYHLTRIYRKLGLRSRSELAARWRQEDGA